jgi:hypothetical protein
MGDAKRQKAGCVLTTCKKKKKKSCRHFSGQLKDLLNFFQQRIKKNTAARSRIFQFVGSALRAVEKLQAGYRGDNVLDAWESSRRSTAKSHRPAAAE